MYITTFFPAPTSPNSRPFVPCRIHVQNINKLMILELLCKAISATDFTIQPPSKLATGRMQLLTIAVMWPWLVTPLQAQLQHKGAAGKIIAEEMGLVMAASQALENMVTQRSAMSQLEIKQVKEGLACDAAQVKLERQAVKEVLDQKRTKKQSSLTKKYVGFSSAKQKAQTLAVIPQKAEEITKIAEPASATPQVALDLHKHNDGLEQPISKQETWGAWAGQMRTLVLNTVNIIKARFASFGDDAEESGISRESPATLASVGRKESSSVARINKTVQPADKKLTPPVYKYRDPGRQKLKRKG